MKSTLKGLYRRGGVWWYRHTPTPGAQQERVSLKTSDEGEAILAVLKLKEQAPLAESKEFEEELEAYFAAGIASKRLSRFTVQMRRYAAKDYAATAKITRISAITPESLERWMDDLRRRDFKPNSVDSYFMHTRGFITHLVTQGKLRENPCARVKLGRAVVRVRTNFLPKEAIRDCIAKAPSDEMRFVMYCGFHAGMRSLEIIEARPDWFRLSDGARRGTVKIGETATYRPKDKEERTIPLSREFEAFLRRYLPTLPSGAAYCFRPAVLPRPKRLRRTTFARGFVLFMKSLGHKCSPHDMRRSFVSTKLHEDGSLIFKISKWTGTNILTLQKHYAHLLADDDAIDVGL